jgi:hypothetical protein
MKISANLADVDATHLHFASVAPSDASRKLGRQAG